MLREFIRRQDLDIDDNVGLNNEYKDVKDLEIQNVASGKALTQICF
jgi:hypothetical protein